jgi:hypothetical protein
MSLKDFDQLRAEINAAVHTNGPLGKTTALGLNALLQSFATELTTLPSAVGSSPFIIEQDLSSRSTSSIPSVAAVAAAISSATTSNVLYVKNTGQTTPGVRGDSTKPFATITAALSAAYYGDVLEVYPAGDLSIEGSTAQPYPENVSVRTSVSIVCYSDVIFSGEWNIPAPPSLFRDQYVRVKGGKFTNKVWILRELEGGMYTSWDECVFDLSQTLLFQDFGAHTYQTDTHTFNRCLFKGSGNVMTFLSRGFGYGYGEAGIYTFRDCAISNSSYSNFLFTGNITAMHKLVLAGTTTLTSPNPQPYNLNSDGTPLSFATAFTDNRYLPASSGPMGVTAADLAAARATVLVGAIQAGDYTLVVADAGTLVLFAVSATCTIPADTFALGTVIEVMNQGAVRVTITGASAVTLVAPTGPHTPPLDGASVRLFQRAQNQWVLTGGSY